MRAVPLMRATSLAGYSKMNCCSTLQHDQLDLTHRPQSTSLRYNRHNHPLPRTRTMQSPRPVKLSNRQTCLAFSSVGRQRSSCTHCASAYTDSITMATPARTMRLVTPIMRSQTSLLQPRYASLLNPTLSATQASPFTRRITSPATPRLASPASSHSSTSHDSHGEHSGSSGGSEDRSAPNYGLHFHRAEPVARFGIESVWSAHNRSAHTQTQRSSGR